jgi:hypothetical protein
MELSTTRQATRINWFIDGAAIKWTDCELDRPRFHFSQRKRLLSPPFRPDVLLPYAVSYKIVQGCFLSVNLMKHTKKLRDLCPRANYTDRAPPLVGEVSANLCG